MRRFFIFTTFFIILFASCDQQEDLTAIATLDDVGSENLKISKEINNSFDWEKNNFVTVNGKKIILPWYSGAKGNIPYSILSDYKKVDGWEMVYNFLTEKNEENLNTIIFYNKFKGIIRVFYYNEKSPTTGAATFAKFDLSSSNVKILNSSNSSDIFCLTAEDAGVREVYTSNITNLPTKAISAGWNCFELELAYDPFLTNATKGLFSLNYYDQVLSKIYISGKSTTTGQIKDLVTTSSNPWGNIADNIFGSMANATGAEAEKLLFPKKVDTTKTLVNAEVKVVPVVGAVIGAAVSSIVSNGISYLTKKWTSSWSKSEKVYKTLDVTMESNFKLEGSINSNISSSGTSIQNLKIPGASNEVSELTIIPAYDNSLGVWTITKAKPILVGDHILKTLKVITGEYSKDPNFANEEIEFFLENQLVVDKSSVVYGKQDIVLNPATLSCISDYTVKSEIMIAHKISDPNSGMITHEIVPFVNNIDDYVFGLNGVINNSSARIKYANTYIYGNKHIMTNSRAQELIKDAERAAISWNPVDYKKENSFFVIKITVDLYPKAPYNEKDVISTTKTFKTPIQYFPVSEADAKKVYILRYGLPLFFYN